MRVTDLDDSELLAHLDDPDRKAELVRRYTPMCHAVAAEFANLSHEDSVQECGLALLAASRHYDPSRGATFGTYAWTCMRNRLCRLARQKRVRTAAMAEHATAQPLDEDDLDVWTDRQEDLQAQRELVRHKLSPYEYRVYTLVATGNSATEIALLLSTPDKPLTVKSVNNALQRIRRKLRR